MISIAKRQRREFVVSRIAINFVNNDWLHLTVHANIPFNTVAHENAAVERMTIEVNKSPDHARYGPWRAQ